jgi:hypothetical protein
MNETENVQLMTRQEIATRLIHAEKDDARIGHVVAYLLGLRPELPAADPAQTAPQADASLRAKRRRRISRTAPEAGNRLPKEIRGGIPRADLKAAVLAAGAGNPDELVAACEILKVALPAAEHRRAWIVRGIGRHKTSMGLRMEADGRWTFKRAPVAKPETVDA